MPDGIITPMKIHMGLQRGSSSGWGVSVPSKRGTVSAAALVSQAIGFLVASGAAKEVERPKIKEFKLATAAKRAATRSRLESSGK